MRNRHGDVVGHGDVSFLHAELLLDPESGPSEGALVTIQDGLIADLSTTEMAQGGAIRTKVLVPGYVDTHVHALGGTGAVAWSNSRQLIHGVRNMASALAAGITTAADLGARGAFSFELAQAEERGDIPGPRLVCAGQAICMTGGHAHDLGVEADGPNAVRRATREQLKRGAGVIKIMATGGSSGRIEKIGSLQLTLDEQKAAVEEARKQGKPTMAHANGAEGTKVALHAGVDVIQHGTGLDAEAIELMVSRKVVLVPTFSIYEVLAHGDNGVPDYVRDKARTIYESHPVTTRQAVDAGVQLALGTDSGGTYLRMGNLQLEFGALTKLGLDTDAILRIATLNGARALAMADTIGSIAVGKVADLVELAADPRSDPSAWTKVVAVWRRGVRYSTSALRQMSLFETGAEATPSL